MTDSVQHVRGRRIGVDPGSVRIGIAMCDPDGILATPLATIQRDKSGAHLRQIAALVAEWEAVEVIVGRPIGLSGNAGASAAAADDLAAAIAAAIDPVPVSRIDERLSTVDATASLRAAGVSGRRQRSVVDQAAAVVILQTWLDRRRAASAVRDTSGDADISDPRAR